MGKNERGERPAQAILAAGLAVFIHSWTPLGVFALLAYGAPRFEVSFAESGTPLPAATQVVLQMSLTFRSFSTTIALGTVVLLALDGVLHFSLYRGLGRGFASIWSGTIVVLEVAFAAFCVFALTAPLYM